MHSTNTANSMLGKEDCWIIESGMGLCLPAPEEVCCHCSSSSGLFASLTAWDNGRSQGPDAEGQVCREEALLGQLEPGLRPVLLGCLLLPCIPQYSSVPPVWPPPLSYSCRIPPPCCVRTEQLPKDVENGPACPGAPGMFTSL